VVVVGVEIELFLASLWEVESMETFASNASNPVVSFNLASLWEVESMETFPVFCVGMTYYKMYLASLWEVESMETNSIVLYVNFIYHCLASLWEVESMETNCFAQSNLLTVI